MEYLQTQLVIQVQGAEKHAVVQTLVPKVDKRKPNTAIMYVTH